MTCNFNSDSCPTYLTNFPIGTLGADFQWIRASGQTPTFGTGPPSDRSGTGMENCYYTFLLLISVKNIQYYMKTLLPMPMAAKSHITLLTKLIKEN